MGKKKDGKDKYSKSVMKAMELVNEKIRSEQNDQGFYELKKSVKHKKKDFRTIRCICNHWRPDKDHVPQPTIDEVPGKPGIVRCRICRAEFPWLIKTIDPAFPEQSPYTKQIDEMEAALNTVIFYNVKYAGGKDKDTEVFTALRRGLDEFRKISYAVSATFTKQQQYINRTQNASSDMNAFTGAGFRFS